jgi:hypothetical protein
MRLLVASKVELGRNLQVEVVVDIACSHDVGIHVIDFACLDNSFYVVVNPIIFLNFNVYLLQVHHILF